MTTRIFDPATAKARDRLWLELEADFARRGAIPGARIESTDLMLVDAGRLTCRRRPLPAAAVATPGPAHP